MKLIYGPNNNPDISLELGEKCIYCIPTFFKFFNLFGYNDVDVCLNQA